MGTKTKNNKINFCKNPYRGVFAKVAQSKGVSRQAVKLSYDKNLPEIVEAVNEEVTRRRKIIKEKANSSNLIEV